MINTDMQLKNGLIKASDNIWFTKIMWHKNSAIYIGMNAILPMTKKDIIRTAWGKYIKLTIPENSLKLVYTGNIILNWNQKKNKYTTIMKKNLGNIDVSYI